ncbi:DNA-binding protein inhibitor ID-1 [Latimeria chalumnae]|uniref:Inhibitor of DNA binding 1 n=1 Tax=Latimeria chalumnae TaxID=7897 RepID=H3AFY1_LATCH|nr:PREDICTED: DNA-binding protein inhibitor ID-1 [Latimeria chalumnae]|eukprot:XP_006009385.1 PREDICTED: DNA-binding protein inhibitor ID-1 [Latimeria chalumnae]
MKVVSATCALKTKMASEDMVRCLSEQSIAISKCKPLLDDQINVFLYDMNGCYSKLKELVPTLPQNKKVSKVEILQHVIDYISDLQLELDTQPNLGRPVPNSRAPLTTLNAELTAITAEAACMNHDDRILCR